ncbi:MAG TPA: hypothetical protein VK988_01135 [Acidimicrobiales bacterium]|nr:hypothetical protein [Acidimicrobiales bacterium]
MDKAAEVPESEAHRDVEDELIVAAVAVGCSNAEGAEVAGVSVRTVARPMAVPAFRRRVAEGRGEHVQIVAARLTLLRLDAVAALVPCLSGEDKKGRVPAVRLILQFGLKYRDRADMRLTWPSSFRRAIVAALPTGFHPGVPGPHQKLGRTSCCLPRYGPEGLETNLEEEPVDETSECHEGEARREGQDEILVAALATGRSYTQAGEKAGVSARTVARRMADPAFSHRVALARTQQVHLLTGLLLSHGEEAVALLASCLGDEQGKNGLAAAKLTLELILRFSHHADLEQAVAEIRQKLKMED